MAKNTDKDVGIDTNDFIGSAPRRLPLGGKEKFGFAIANEESILESAHMLRALGDLDLEQDVCEAEAEQRRRELKRRVYDKNYFPSCAKKVLKTLNTVLDWLEQSAKDLKDKMKKPKRHDNIDGETKDNVDGKQPNSYEYPSKKEGVLRGLYHITGLGSYTCLVGILELVCESLDLSEYEENRYNAKREHIKECLKEVEKQNPKLSELVEKACDIMQEIIRDDKINHNKAAAFNSTVRQANTIIESCKDFLSNAEKNIDELMQNTSTIKIASRLLRFAGFGATCYGLYHMSPSESTVDSLATYIPPTGLTLMRGLILNRGVKFAVGFATCAVAGCAWLSLFPSRAYTFRDDVVKLKLKHELLTCSLRGLERRLEVASEDVHKSNQLSDREDSV